MQVVANLADKPVINRFRRLSHVISFSKVMIRAMKTSPDGSRGLFRTVFMVLTTSAACRIHCNAEGQVASQDLSKEEVKRRLALYESDEVTQELYGFGTMLINNAVQRL